MPRDRDVYALHCCAAHEDGCIVPFSYHPLCFANIEGKIIVLALLLQIIILSSSSLQVFIQDFPRHNGWNPHKDCVIVCVTQSIRFTNIEAKSSIVE